MSSSIRKFIVREDAGDDGELIAARPPEVAYEKYVHCGFCSTILKNINPRDTHPQCPWCGNLIDLTEYRCGDLQVDECQQELQRNAAMV